MKYKKRWNNPAVWCLGCKRQDGAMSCEVLGPVDEAKTLECWQRGLMLKRYPPYWHNGKVPRHAPCP